MLKDTLYEAAYSVLKSTYLFEMAIGKKNYSDRIFSLLPQVISHYLFIKAKPNASTVNHWRAEIVGILSPLMGMKYSHTKKYPTAKNFLEHINSSGHEFDAEGFTDTYTRYKRLENLPVLDHEQLDHIAQDFSKFMNVVANKIEKGLHITINDVV
jgi:hypothetical protein